MEPQVIALAAGAALVVYALSAALRLPARWPGAVVTFIIVIGLGFVLGL